MELIDQAKQLRESSPSLSLEKRKAIFWYFLLERLFAKPKLNRFWLTIQAIYLKYLHFMRKPSPFLNNEISPQITTGDYKYPSRYPEFLAYIGLHQIAKWPATLEVRRKHEIELINALQRKFFLVIPKAIDSTGLRVVFSDKETAVIAKSIGTFVDLESSWFKKPIINTNCRMEEFGYILGTATNAEFLGERIINIPILDSPSQHSMLIKRIMVNKNHDKSEMY
jgi:hypothetical protein